MILLEPPRERVPEQFRRALQRQLALQVYPVRFHCFGRDPQNMRDLPGRNPLTHPRQNLELTIGQFLNSSLPRLPAPHGATHQSLGDRFAHRNLSAPDCVKRRQQFFGCRILHQISTRPRRDRSQRIEGLVVNTQHKHTHLGQLCVYSLDQFQAVLPPGKTHIHNRQVRLHPPHSLQGNSPIAPLTHPLKTALRAQNRPQPRTQQRVILHHAQSNRTPNFVPPSGLRRTSRSTPSSPHNRIAPPLLNRVWTVSPPLHPPFSTAKSSTRLKQHPLLSRTPSRPASCRIRHSVRGA